MKPAVVASECCAGSCPQNTLSGFRHCISSGVDGIEFDVHLSRDGQVVVQHDYRLNPRITRGPDGQWLPEPGPPVCQLSTAELRQYDVGRYAPGSRESLSYPGYEPVDGEPIPTLAEFIAVHRDTGAAAQLWIELKTSTFQRDISSDPDALLDQVLDLVVTNNLVANTVLLAFEWDVLVRARRLCPGIQADFLTINHAYIEARYRRLGNVRPADMYGSFDPADYGDSWSAAIAAAGGQWWGPYVTDVDAAAISQAQARGLKVNVWGVESDAESIEHALALGADALTISDSGMLQQRIINGRG